GRPDATRLRRGARGDHALLANLDGHRLGAAMREALADLAGLDRPAQAEGAPRPQRQRPFLLLLVGFLLVRFSHAFWYHHPVAPAQPAQIPSRIPPPPRHATRRAATGRATGADTADRRPPPHARSARGRTQHRARSNSARWPRA